ncbi:MAG: aminopeptidase N [Bdellovibrionota bacterium]
MMLKIKTLAILLLTALGCSSTPPSQSGIFKNGNTPEQQSRTAGHILTRAEAATRSRQIAKTSYILWFGLDDVLQDFEGRVVVNFELLPKAKDFSNTVFLDFEEGDITSIRINDGPLAQGTKDAKRYDGHRIHFNISELQPGMNRIEIAFTHPFSKNGNGLYRYVDPEDGKVYLYSNFEPFSAHKVFPCLDQPDIKASFELTVETPDEWEVISNTKEREVTTVDGRKSWAFPPSPILSTYLFALHAGPYSVWKSEAGGIPLRLFTRKALAKYVDHKELFDITSRGLDFFSVQFGYPYPFSKYDQVIVPDFNMGGMENAAATTLSERIIFRSKVTQDQLKNRADLILHELSHMWFGDLVTMRWWNGLWLNESFASFMATLALDEATNFHGAWQAFSSMKEWAYWEDQLVTTHPVEGQVADTDHALTNFDGITYGKGAAALKQLRFYLGQDDFREGIQRYFQKYAFRNTTLADFMKMLSEASGKDLSKWQHAWLQTSGVATVKAKWSCQVNEARLNSIDSFKLLHELPQPSDGKTLTHKTQVALYYFSGPNKKNLSIKPPQPARVQGKNRNKPARGQENDPGVVTYSSAETEVPALIGKPCPAFVFPNHDDHDYVKVELDPASLGVISKNLAGVEDAFVRQMLWHTLWQMVVDGKMSALDFADTVFAHVSKEKNTRILQKLFTALTSKSANKASVLKFLPDNLRPRFHEKLENFVWKGLSSSPPGSDLQLIWYKAYLDSAFSTRALEFLKNLLSDRAKLPGFKVERERRWEIISALARNGTTGVQELIAKELVADATDIGKRAAISAEAAMPDASVKKQWLTKMLNYTQANPEIPIAKLREAMWSFQLVGQEDLITATVDEYFNTITKIANGANSNDEEFLAYFTNSMFPSLCSQVIVQKTSAALEAEAKLPAQVVKILKIKRQEEERCIRARAKAAERQAPSQPASPPPSTPSATPSAS